MKFKIIPKSAWATKMVNRYGEVCKLGKENDLSKMFVNDECEDPYDHTFQWGFWIYNDEMELQEVQ